MSLLSLVIVLVVVGMILWLVNTYVPMGAKTKNVLNVLVIIVVILWLLSVFGVINNTDAIKVPKIGAATSPLQSQG